MVLEYYLVVLHLEYDQFHLMPNPVSQNQSHWWQHYLDQTPYRCYVIYSTMQIYEKLIKMTLSRQCNMWWHNWCLQKNIKSPYLNHPYHNTNQRLVIYGIHGPQLVCYIYIRSVCIPDIILKYIRYLHIFLLQILTQILHHRLKILLRAKIPICSSIHKFNFPHVSYKLYLWCSKWLILKLKIKVNTLFEYFISIITD